MGYTHYWKLTEQLSAEKFGKFVEGAKQIVATAEEAGVEIGEQEFTETVIAFNGVGAGSHETFVLTTESGDFDFCKTAFKPYDMAVTACLILAKKIFGEAITISSDGTWDEWQSGQLLYESVFSVTPENVFG